MCGACRRGGEAALVFSRRWAGQQRGEHARDEVRDPVLALLLHAELLLCEDLGDRRVSGGFDLGTETGVARVVDDDVVRPSGGERREELRAEEHALHADAVAEQQRRRAGIAVGLIPQLDVQRRARRLVLRVHREPLRPHLDGRHPRAPCPSPLPPRHAASLLPAFGGPDAPRQPQQQQQQQQQQPQQQQEGANGLVNC